ncbi:UNKNOWN [Stylonychia lemnae]|uniref:Uncharacterized protein n=1 Tax=Stylonychia lemnae TaxID=5949 RepID=A0A078A018_STYLE|nr:UNKNOWN [Stylonychia lemnae]|eukprot:CDW75531.1 UNKNOWN [Stylonychia lemnae]
MYKKIIIQETIQQEINFQINSCRQTQQIIGQQRNISNIRSSPLGYNQKDNKNNNLFRKLGASSSIKKTLCMSNTKSKNKLRQSALMRPRIRHTYYDENRGIYSEQRPQQRQYVDVDLKNQFLEKLNSFIDINIYDLISDGCPFQIIKVQGERACDLYQAAVNYYRLILARDIKSLQLFIFHSRLPAEGLEKQIEHKFLELNEATYDPFHLYIIYTPRMESIQLYDINAKNALEKQGIQRIRAMHEIRDQNLNNITLQQKINFVLRSTQSTVPANTMIQIDHSDYENDPFLSASFKKLIDQLKRQEKALGSKIMAYDIEWKVRQFVMQVLIHAFEEQNLRIDGEVPINVFGKRISPDLQVISNDASNQTLYIIELKKVINRSNNVNQGSNKLEDALYQNFQQLRHHCIQNRQMKMLGVLTNYKEWYITQYSFKKEFDYQLERKFNKNSLVSEQRFEISQKFTILNDDFKLDVLELKKIINILEWLAITFNS